MSNLYDDFEKRFTNAWFSVGWADVEKKQQPQKNMGKDLNVLQEELENIEKSIEDICQRQIELAKLAMQYNYSSKKA